MHLPTWKSKSKNTEQDSEEEARRLHEAAWPEMFAHLQSAYAELTNAQFELERRTAEISETRDLFQQVISSMSEALFLTDRSGRVIRANPAAAALLECAETSILGRPLTAVCGSDDIPATPWKLMEIAPIGRITNLDADLHTLGGVTIPVSFSFCLMHDKQNKITGVLAVARDMREQRSLIRSLIAARTRFQELLEFAPDAIVLVDHDGEIVLVNSQTERLFGYKRDELLGSNVEVLVPERFRGQISESSSGKDDELPNLDDIWAGHLTGRVEQIEFCLLDRDGREFPAEIARRQIETEEGSLVMSLVRDISERQRTESSRRAIEAPHQKLFDNVDDIIFTQDLEGNFTNLNKATERLTGYQLKEALQMNLKQVVAPEYLSQAQQRINDHLAGHSELPPIGLEIFCKDGSRLPIELSTRLMMENGQPIGILTIARDMSEHRNLFDLLDKNEPEEAAEFSPIECLNYCYEYEALPEDMLQHITTRMRHFIEDELRWRTGVILSFEEARALVKAVVDDRKIFIHVSGDNEARGRLLAAIRFDFERIHADLKLTFRALGQQELNSLILIETLKQENHIAAQTETDEEPVHVFISYSQKDERYRQEMETHLKLLHRKGLIATWHDRLIKPGTEWRNAIDVKLKQAQIILLLISPDFISSDYCWDIEMKQALERHEKKEAVIIPIFIRDAKWKGTPIAELQGLPNGGKALKQWKDKDKAWGTVVEGIENAATEWRKKRQPADDAS